MIKYFLPIILLFILCNAVQAQISICELSGKRAADCLNSIQTAVPLLRTNLDARSSGMGDAGIALSSKTNAIFFNSAKMVFDEHKAGLSLSYIPWLPLSGEDIFLTNLTGFGKINKNHAIGASIRYFSMDPLFTDFYGQELPRYARNEYCIDLAYSIQVNTQFSLGTNLKYIHSHLVRGVGYYGLYKTGEALAFDLSAFYAQPLNFRDTKGNLNIGISISNIGNKISYFEYLPGYKFLPANLGIGLAYEVLFNDGNKLNIAYDANKLLVPTAKLDGSHLEQSAIGGMFSSFTDTSFKEEWTEITHSFGLEGVVKLFKETFVMLRTGVFHEHQNKGNRNYTTYGLGFRYKPIEVAISYIIDDQFSPLRNTYKVSLQYHL